jgi:hypothetical protein
VLWRRGRSNLFMNFKYKKPATVTNVQDMQDSWPEKRGRAVPHV